MAEASHSIPTGAAVQDSRPTEVATSSPQSGGGLPTLWLPAVVPLMSQFSGGSWRVTVVPSGLCRVALPLWLPGHWSCTWKSRSWHPNTHLPNTGSMYSRNVVGVAAVKISELLPGLFSLVLENRIVHIHSQIPLWSGPVRFKK